MKEWSYKGRTIQLADGDIAEQDTEALTTAAHWRLNGGNGTDGTHAKGGKAIIEECREIGGCPIGDAVVTGVGNLKAEYVIHAVGPVWDTEKDEQHTKKLLASAYRNTLKRASEIGVKSVSIPAISTGAFAMPFDWAVPIAIGSVFDYLDTDASQLQLVRHVVYTREFERVKKLFRDEIETQLLVRFNRD